MGSKGLTKEIIVQEAVALIEESGQWVISLHELARRLQVKTPSLYNHIANTKDLQREVFRCKSTGLWKTRRPPSPGKKRMRPSGPLPGPTLPLPQKTKGCTG